MDAQRQVTNFEFLAGNLQTHHAVEIENKMRIFAQLSGDWNHSTYFVYNGLLAVGSRNNVKKISHGIFLAFLRDRKCLTREKKPFVNSHFVEFFNTHV